MPGIQPKQVSYNTINTEPHPRLTTAKGGNKIDRITSNIDIIILF